MASGKATSRQPEAKGGWWLDQVTLNVVASGIEEFGRPRKPHKLEILGSNPSPAT